MNEQIIPLVTNFKFSKAQTGAKHDGGTFVHPKLGPMEWWLNDVGTGPFLTAQQYPESSYSQEFPKVLPASALSSLISCVMKKRAGINKLDTEFPKVTEDQIRNTMGLSARSETTTRTREGET